MGVCETEGPGADCGSVYTASVILALFPGQLMWRAGADWCAQLCTAAADLCAETMLSVFPALQKERECVCVVLEDTHRMLVDLQRQTWPGRQIQLGTEWQEKTMRGHTLTGLNQHDLRTLL